MPNFAGLHTTVCSITQVESIHPLQKGPPPLGVSVKNYDPLYLVNGLSVSFKIYPEDTLHSGIEPFKIKITIFFNKIPDAGKFWKKKFQNFF